VPRIGNDCAARGTEHDVRDSAADKECSQAGWDTWSHMKSSWMRRNVVRFDGEMSCSASRPIEELQFQSFGVLIGVWVGAGLAA
jgi:hypothetical protein